MRPGDQLPRGVVNSPNRRYVAPPSSPQNAGGVMMEGDGMGAMGMGMGAGYYLDEPYYYEDGPMVDGMMDCGVMMEDEYL